MKTMKQALMQLLLKQWVTPLDALNKVGCMSLSQRCGEFAAEYWMWCGMMGFGTESSRAAMSVCPPPKVISKWVKLPSGKRVKAYRAIK